MTDNTSDKEQAMDTEESKDPFLLPGLSAEELEMFNTVHSAFAYPERAEEYLIAMKEGKLNIPVAAKEWLEQASKMAK